MKIFINWKNLLIFNINNFYFIIFRIWLTFQLSTLFFLLFHINLFEILFSFSTNSIANFFNTFSIIMFTLPQQLIKLYLLLKIFNFVISTTILAISRWRSTSLLKLWPMDQFINVWSIIFFSWIFPKFPFLLIDGPWWTFDSFLTYSEETLVFTGLENLV